jgi:hypothetical protein
MYLDRRSPALEEKRSHSDVPLQIGATNPSQLDKQEDHRLSTPDRLSFEVVESVKSPRIHSTTFASYSPNSLNANLTWFVLRSRCNSHHVPS